MFIDKRKDLIYNIIMKNVMSKIKKIFALCIISIISFNLMSCGNDALKNNNNETNAKSNVEETSAQTNTIQLTLED